MPKLIFGQIIRVDSYYKRKVHRFYWARCDCNHKAHVIFSSCKLQDVFNQFTDKYGNFVNWVKKKKNISVHSSYINIVTDCFKLTSFHPTIILKMCLLSLCSCQNSFDWLKNSLLSYFVKPDMIGQEKSWVCEQQLRMFRLWSSFSEPVLSALSHFLNGEDLKSLALTFC